MEAYADPLKYYPPDPANETDPKGGDMNSWGQNSRDNKSKCWGNATIIPLVKAN